MAQWLHVSHFSHYNDFAAVSAIWFKQFKFIQATVVYFFMQDSKTSTLYAKHDLKNFKTFKQQFKPV